MEIIYLINIRNEGLVHILYQEGGTVSNFEGVYYLDDAEKIKILFEDQIIFIVKENNSYFISGEPIYFINPGNEEYELKRQ